MYRPNYLSFQEGGQQDQGQDQANQIMQMVAQALQQGTPPEQVMQMLVQQGIPQEQAQQIIQQVMSQMQGQQSQMQQGGFKPKYLGVKPNSIDSLFYKSDFYGTPTAASVNMNYYQDIPQNQGLIPQNLAQKDYINQLINTIKQNPELKKKVEKILPMKFKNGGMRPKKKKLKFDY